MLRTARSSSQSPSALSIPTALLGGNPYNRFVVALRRGPLPTEATTKRNLSTSSGVPQTAAIHRTLDISGLVTPPVEIITEETTRLYIDRRVRPSGKVQIPDSLATKLRTHMDHSLQALPHSKEKDKLQKTVQDFLMGKFPVLYLTGISIPGLDWHPEDPMENLFQKPAFMACNNIATALMCGVLRMNFFHSEQYRRIRPLHPKHFAPRNSFDTTDRLAWHTDNSSVEDQNKIPPFTFLFGLSNPNSTLTLFIGADDIFNRLSPEHQRILCEPNFTNIDNSNDYPMPEGAFPIFYRNSDGTISIRYSEFGNIQPLHTTYKEAFDALQQTIKTIENEGKVIKIAIEPGSVLVFRNAPLGPGINVVHARDKELNVTTAAPSRLVLRADATYGQAIK